jgi:predicted ATPase/class 3 adenylate cyclase
MPACAACGHENRPEARFCDYCGAALAEAKTSSAREERKVVTVVFCDLVGFTQRAEQMDPEDVSALLTPYHERVRSELERHGGTVEKFIGDAVMALFGAPTAHEDDPERAIRAALAIRDWAQDEGEVQVRIAVTSGEALIRLDSRPEAGEGMASGDVVNTAARLQGAAPVNGVLADETTYRATRQAIEYVMSSPIEAKGKAEPIPVWVATGARSRFGIDVAHHARTGLVGREPELDALRDAFERARRSRTPQLVTLIGVPGIGKSRLVYELQKIVDADPELVTWRQGRCLAYGDGVAFWALAEVVKAQAGILERDSQAQAAAKLHVAAADAFEVAGDARWVESHLSPLVGLGTETGLGGDRRGEAFAAWRRYLEALADRRPLVLVLEDLHWADEGLLDFVEELIDWLHDVPLLVVCSARPELLERRPGWVGGKLNAATLGLSPLSNDETSVFIAQVLERVLLPAATQQALLERAEGNPLYAEQFAELYLERGSVDDLQLPETLQGIVAARLDGLPSDEKAVLRDASVVGKVFWTGALHRDEPVSRPLLHALARKGFLTYQRRSSIEGEGEWAFAHMLLRDVAYGQIPRAERAEKHRETAEWIESLGRSEDHAELLAFHWSSALELARASGQETGDLEKPARLAFRAAGERALAVNSYRAAATYYREALELWPDGEEERPELLLRFGQALVESEGRATDVLIEARDQLLAAGDRETTAEAEVLLADISFREGDRDRLAQHVAAAAALVSELPPSRVKALVLSHVSRYHMLAEANARAIATGEEAIAMASALGLDEIRAHALNNVGSARVRAGDRSGMDELEESIRIARAINSPECVRGYTNLSTRFFDEGDLARWWQLAAEGVRAAEEFGDARSLRWLRTFSLKEEYHRGRWDEALRHADEWIEECEAGSPHYHESEYRYVRSLIRLAQGEIASALDDSQKSVAVARRAKDPQALSPALSSRAFVLFETGLEGEADAVVEEILSALPGAIGRIGQIDVAWVVARLGRQEEFVIAVEQIAWRSLWLDAATAIAEGDFERAADLFSTIGSAPEEAFARLRAAQKLAEKGSPGDAEKQLQKALAFYRSVGATLFIERGEQLLAKSA